MILQWKSRGPLEQQAVWQGRLLSLLWNPERSRWQLTVKAAPGGVLVVGGVEFPEGALVRQEWHTPNAAKDAIDAAVERAIRALDPPPVAAQRPLFTRAVPGHLGSTKSNFAPTGARSGRAVGGKPNFTEVDKKAVRHA